MSVLLLCLGSLRIALSIFNYAISRDGPDVPELAAFNLLLLCDLLIGAGMIIASRFVELHPRRVALAVLAGWILSQALVLLLAPMSFVMGLLGRLFFTTLLIRCVFSARAAEVLSKKLMSAPVSP